MKILVIQQKMIGDVLTTGLLFEALKISYPESELHYVVNSNTEAVVKNNPFIDKLIFVSPETQSGTLALFKFIKTLKRENYDVVIDAYSKLSSNLMSLFSAAKMKISKHKWYTAWIYTHPVKYFNERQTAAGLAIENRFQLLSPLSIKLAPYFKPRIYLTKKEKSESAKFLMQYNIDTNKPLFMIAVLGSGPSKTYPAKYMAAVLNHLVKQTQAQILFNYIPSQEEEAREIYDLCLKETRERIYFDIYAKDLRSFLGILDHCHALIGNEGGAINMAKALDVPTFTIFSPWIDKATWSIFEDEFNVSVHLKDFQPEYYKDGHEARMKSKTEDAYRQFKPELFKDQFENFLNRLKLRHE